MFWLGQQMRKRRPLTDHDILIIKHLDEARDYWREIRDKELTPLPDLHLLKHIGRSPSGTLFPRYLIIGLRKLRERAGTLQPGVRESENQTSRDNSTLARGEPGPNIGR